MLGLKRNKTKGLKSSDSKPIRLGIIKPPSTYSIRLNKETKPIWNKEKPAAAWFALFFLAASLLILLVAIGSASPPISRGARPIALGNGYSSVAGDVYSLFYNPGGLFDINQEQVAVDFGRSYSEFETARTEFNGMYATPWNWREQYVPLAFGFYGEQAAPGAHIIDLTAGAATRAPVDAWTKGIIRLPATGGVAVNFRHQQGEDRSSRIGGSKIALGVTAGLHFKIDRKHEAGAVIRNLYLGDGNARGASINIGVQRRHRRYLTMMIDMEYAKGGVFRFQPGMEWILYRGVLRPRLGWGFRDNNGVDSVATGVGFNLSPMQLDITYLIPVKTLTDNAGQFRASLSYKFGNPQFTEIYYDRALEAATSLDKTVLDLTVQEAELKSSVAELTQKLRLAREELKNSKGRIESLKDKDILAQRDESIRKLRARVRELEGQLNSQRSQNRALRRKKATIRTHKVVPGDTLQSLANKYYGDANQWKKIYTANPDKIERGLPRVGAKLVIP